MVPKGDRKKIERKKGFGEGRSGEGNKQKIK